MQILMLGNSYTFYHHMPDTLADILNCTVVAHTRGGARLAEQLNPDTEMGARTLQALAQVPWDYVVMQEMSNGPLTSPTSFFTNVAALCEKIRANGATPVLYATWAYAPNGEPMSKMSCTYDEMFHKLYDAYHQAARENNALIADVGQAFFTHPSAADLYMPDGTHPTPLGSQIAAETIAHVIQEDQKNQS